MSWAQIAVGVIGSFLGAVVVVAGTGYGARVWWAHRRLGHCRHDELRREVAAIRACQHREHASGPESGLTSGGVPAVAPDQQAPSPCCGRSRSAGRGRFPRTRRDARRRPLPTWTCCVRVREGLRNLPTEPR